MNPRTRSIRTRIVLLLLVPVLSLVAFWSFTAVGALGESLDHRAAERSTARVRAAVGGLASALGAERQATAAFLAGPADAPRTALDAARARTDTAVRGFRAGARRERATAGGGGAGASGALREALRELDRLPATRNAADGRTLEPLEAIDAYGAAIEKARAVTARRASATDGALVDWDAGLAAGGRAMDLMARESALVAAAAARDGRLTEREHRRFVEAVAAQRMLWAEQRARVPARVYRRVLAPPLTSPAFGGFRALEEGIAGASPKKAEVDGRQWTVTIRPLLGSLDAAHRQASRMLEDEQRARGGGLATRSWLVGGLGLAAVLLSLAVAFRSGRGLARELAELAALRAATAPAAHRPGKRPGKALEAKASAEDGTSREPAEAEETGAASDGGEASQEDEASPTASRTLEIRQVAEALTALRRDAAEAREGRSELREGVSRVFLNIARRNQSLLHRQLVLLDDLRGAMGGAGEGAAGDGRIERLGHLATRMRRNAESLIILSGAGPGRTRREAVPVTEVLAEAVAEIEESDRVTVVTRAREGLVGGAVPDMVHLLAELLENATTFSPPGTGVRLLAERVGGGFAFEVEDRGLGMGPEEMERLNRRLASAPDLDLAETDRLGLLVVARLAARHGARVSLRPSPYGGTTAIVVLPQELVVPAERVPPRAPGRELLATRPASSGPSPTPGGPAPGGSGYGDLGTGGAADGGGAPARAASAADREPVPGLRSAGGTPVQNNQDAPEPGVPAANAVPAGNPWFDDVAAPAAPAAAGQGGVGHREGGRPPAPDAGARTAGGAGPVDGGGRPPGPAGLQAGPARRRRQASLAPRPRNEYRTPPAGTVEPGAAEQGPAGTAVRTPEEARSLMTSIQRGWRRARASDPGDEEAR